jgi:thiamine biosynthesis protein ThiS
MTIQLNGEPQVLAAPMSVTALLGTLEVDPRRVAVEVNRVVVRRAQYDATVIGDGAEVEIVAFIGGGGA